MQSELLSLDEWPDPDLREDALMRTLIRVYAQPDPREVLTPRELEVLVGLSRGLGRQGTADLLGVSPETVKAQSVTARRALRAKNTTHAVAEALRRGLIT